ncbi:ATP-dependent DNA helicase RecG [Chakrabartyella piscis]|uniref:ATP-dependent DNA helicase RecG n=1 Tax=Chakrabartyella piscis TaxID=2918914 RepID=UPI002958461D|nr:ATP-dependent DNA helicase RecG [Chakrabartyella piscis]
MDWKSPVAMLKGIGEQREKKLNRLGIFTIEDLLTHFPREYKDRSQMTHIGDLELNEESTFLAQVKFQGDNIRLGRFLLTRIMVGDETGVVGALWYNQPYLKNTLIVGNWYLITGKLQKKYGKNEVVVSDFEKVGDNFAGGRILPIYPSVEGLSQKMLRNLMEEALEQVGSNLQEYLPVDIRKKCHLAERNFAIEEIHFPKTEESFHDARRRLVFEEFFVLQGALLTLKSQLTDIGTGIQFKNPDAMTAFQKTLPFDLTGAQKRVLGEMQAEILDGKRMNRLVQGDVGSGKTAVAMTIAYWAIQNGYQVAMMAPTEVLANQHMQSFSESFSKLGIETVLLTGALKAKEKREALAKVANGEAKMIVGTHAVMQKGVEYHNLALAITDEQHRFGVRQRGALTEKGDEPHTLIMTATPIPRTLALILYGDLDISILDELPPGRQKIDTMAVDSRYHERIYTFLEREVAKGRQGYVICPMIAENEKIEVQNVLDYTEELRARLKNCRVACVHGKQKPKEKQETMELFAEGELDILVSTTVIEVGINVPNSTIMLIENAERFGLAQLHQLRGRVGRGGEKSYCILVSDSKSKLSKERLKTLVDSDDGFVISETDLKLRGTGEFFGTRQHGLPELKIANMYTDMPILLEAQKAAISWLADEFACTEDENEKLCQHFGELLQGKTLYI